MLKIKKTDEQSELFDISDMFIGDDLALDFDLGDFNFIGEVELENRYIKPKAFKIAGLITKKNAVDLAKKTKIEKGVNYHYLVQGNFVFGDFIEALLFLKGFATTETYISSLSLSQSNIESLGALSLNGYFPKLTMLISNYFYSHEKQNLVPILLSTLDNDKTDFDLIVLRSHSKIALLNINGFKIVILGSANLRSSNCIEQFSICESEDLYQFYKDFFDQNRNFSIINKNSQNRNKLL